METLSLGPLRVRRVVKGPETSAKSGEAYTVILAHGFGAPGDDLVGLADMIDAPAGTTFLFPEAPHSLSDFTPLPIYGDARAWWLIDIERVQRMMMRGEMGDFSRAVADGMPEAREAFVAMVDALEANGTPASSIVLGGFSQGSMLATDVILRDARPFAGLVVLSGTLASEEWAPRMRSRAGLRVFQSHGHDDPILPFEMAVELRKQFEGAGLATTFRAFDGGHGVPPSVLRDLGAWLR